MDRLLPPRGSLQRLTPEQEQQDEHSGRIGFTSTNCSGPRHRQGDLSRRRFQFRRAACVSAKINRLALTETLEKLAPCIVGMEACLSAHFVSRTLRALGHEPRIIPAIYVKPFVKGQKNDYNDAEAIAPYSAHQKMPPSVAFHRGRSSLSARSRTGTSLEACGERSVE